RMELHASRRARAAEVTADARAAARRGETARAESLVAAATRLDPTWIEPWVLLTLARIGTGRSHEAAEAVTAARAAGVGAAEATALEALLAQRGGDHARAIALVRRVPVATDAAQPSVAAIRREIEGDRDR